jgi:hypothetical protein
VAEGRLLLAISVVLAASALAGCSQPAAEAPGPGPPLPADASPPPSPRGNLWLLDAPRPASSPVSGGSEPFILADRNGEYLWVGDTSGGYYSIDNGSTWSRMGSYQGNAHVAFRDGWVFAQDEKGRLYAAVLHDNRVDVVRSGNGGRSWTQVSHAVGVSGTADRPWIAAQGDDVMMVYFDAPAVVTGLFEHCVHSSDAGLTWTDRNPMAGSPQGGNAVFDSEGRFYYGDHSGRVYRFDNGCLSPTSRSMFTSNVAPFNNMVPIAVEGDTVCMAAATGGNDAIQLSCMRDFGAPKVRTISPDFLTANIFSTITMHEGEIAVAWYGSEAEGDLRQESYDGEFNVYLARVTGFWDEEPVVTYQRITEEANHVGQICIGGITCSETSDRDLLDYFGIDHDIWGGIHVAYVHDGSGSTPQVRYAFVPADGVLPDNGTIPIDPLAPVADFRHQVRGYDVEVDASGSSDPLGQELTFSWDWGDGTTGEGTEASHTYGSYGGFQVRLTATAEDGRIGQAVANILIDGTTSNAGPEAAFAISPAVPEAGEPVTFRDRSEDDGSIVSRVWRFGDGKASAAAEPTHIYEAVGNYTVTHEETDDHCASDSFASLVTVVPVGQGSGDPGQGSGLLDKVTPAAASWLLAIVLLAMAARRR